MLERSIKITALQVKAIFAIKYLDLSIYWFKIESNIQRVIHLCGLLSHILQLFFYAQ
jgi:hypothetical protein